MKQLRWHPLYYPLASVRVIAIRLLQCAPAITFSLMTALTKRVIDATSSASKDTFVWDDDVPGFGLKITPAGRKVFVLQYRLGGRGTPHRYTIGEYGSLTPAQARSIAAGLRHEIATGIDPRQRKIEKSKKRELQKIEPAITISGLIESYAAKHLSKLKSGGDVLKLLDREVRPVWGVRLTESITRREIIAYLDDIEGRCGPYARNHATAAIRQMFGWASARDPDLANPALRLSMNVVKGRDRILSDDEIKQIWSATSQIRSVFSPFTRILLLTGQRRCEVSGMKWSELGELERAVWTIPASRTKNGLVHEVPLSVTAIVILKQLPRLGHFVFTTNNETSISGFSRFKTNLDKVLSTTKHDSDGRKHSRDINPIKRWTFHDLRRTAATMMARQGAPPHVVERVLNHVSGTISGVAKIYNRYEYWEERCRAVSGLAKHIDKLLRADKFGAQGAEPPL